MITSENRWLNITVMGKCVLWSCLTEQFATALCRVEMHALYSNFGVRAGHMGRQQTPVEETPRNISLSLYVLRILRDVDFFM
jgi:hypothetical protein